MKKCSVCFKEKEISEFNKNKIRKDGLNTVCKECSKIRSKQYYHNNKEHHIKNIKRRKKEYLEITRKFIIEYLNTHQCVDCGNSDIRVLEFDHLPEFEKKHNVTDLVLNGGSIKTIQEEIAKCDVVCCNCHRIRTLTRGNTYRAIYHSLVTQK